MTPVGARQQRLCLAVAALAVAACGDEPISPPAPVPVASVTIASSTDSVLLGGRIELTAQALDQDGDPVLGRPVAWTTSDSTIATVSAGGRVTGLALGVVTITATIDGVSGNTEVTTYGLVFASVHAGASFSCGLTTGGRAYCWGWNWNGELGTGSSDTASTTFPVPVSGGLQFTALTARWGGACGIAENDLAYCWGANYAGQLGDGSTTAQAAPVAVSGGLTFDAISGSSSHTCGVGPSGAVHCWGSNSFGQLGDGARVNSLVPTTVVGGQVFASVSSSGYFVSCGLEAGGDAYCWGANYAGQLGYDTTYYSLTPTPVSGAPALVTLDASYDRTCGLNTSGAVHCWGFKRFHHAGKTSFVPQPEASGFVFTTITEGDSHACGLTATGDAYCWGANVYGQLGNGATNQQNEESPPVAVLGGLSLVDISVGDTHTCALTGAGEAYCWGDNTAGQFGNGTTNSSPTTLPVPAASGLTLASIDAGGWYTCGITQGGDAYCWGANTWGTLGNGATGTIQTTPSPVAGSLMFQDIHTSFDGGITCGVATGGAAYCWGSGHAGGLGNGQTLDSPVPVPVAGNLTFAAISLTAHTGCGITTGGSAHCWGANDRGQLGDGSLNHSPIPVPVSGGLTYQHVAVGNSHACGTTTGGMTYCWGDARSGQLGNGVRTDSPMPLRVTGGHSFTQLTTNTAGSCGLTTSGDAYCWPNRWANPPHLPRLVPGGLSFTSLSSGESHICGITNTGAAYCWGDNSSGQLGDGSVSTLGQGSTIPGPVTGGLTFVSISAGASHTCGITTTNIAYCWGANYEGELGDPSSPGGVVPFPVRVAGQP
jgi:alpha-tubulin suppressor-like RCC1 family protein